MKAKNVALAVLVLGMLGSGIWWYGREAEVAPVKAVKAKVPVKAVAPPAVVVEPPKLPPVAISSSLSDYLNPGKPPETNSSQQFFLPEGLSDVGPIDFTEGVPVTVSYSDGTKLTLTAHYIVTEGRSVDQVAISIKSVGSDGRIQSAPRLTVLNGKSVGIKMGEISLKFTAHMNQ